MVALVLATVEGLQTLHALRFRTVGNHGNSVHIDPPAIAYLSNNSIYPGSQLSSPFLDARQVRYHDDPVLTGARTDHLPEHNISLDTEFSNSSPYILLQ
jgi:hypothetical protein